MKSKNTNKTNNKNKALIKRSESSASGCLCLSCSQSKEHLLNCPSNKLQTHSSSSIFTRTDFVEKQYKFFSKFTISNNSGDVENYFRSTLRKEPNCFAEFDIKRYNNNKYQQEVYCHKSLRAPSSELSQVQEFDVFETPVHSSSSSEQEEGIIMSNTPPASPPAGTTGGTGNTPPASPAPPPSPPAGTTGGTGNTPPASPAPPPSPPAGTTGGTGNTPPASPAPPPSPPAGTTGGTGNTPPASPAPPPSPPAGTTGGTGNTPPLSPSQTAVAGAAAATTTTAAGGSELAAVEKLIVQAADALDKAAVDLQSESKTGKAIGEGGSFFKFNPKIDATVLKELEGAEQQAKETAKTTQCLRERIAEILKRDRQTVEEAKELEEKNKELKNQMVLFEEKTKRIQFLLGQSDLFDSMVTPKTPLQVKHNEDSLPRVVVCGYGVDFPRFLLCDNKKVKRKTKPKVNEQDQAPFFPCASAGASSRVCTPRVTFPPQMNLRPSPALVCEPTCRVNPPPGAAAASGDNQTTDSKVVKELESRLKTYTDTTQQLEKQLKEMEDEVKCMHKALSAVQGERENLEGVSSCTCFQSSNPLPSPSSCSCTAANKPQQRSSYSASPTPSSCICRPKPPCPPPPCPCAEQKNKEATASKLRDMEEKYKRLQDDFKSKLTEVACLRTENEKNKQKAKDGQEAKKEAENKLRQIEKELKLLKAERGKMMGSKEQEVEIEQQLAVAKERFREAQDELEELRAATEEQKNQLIDYRDKYLTAQQEVEEQKRKMGLLESENQKAVDEANAEMKKVMQQFEQRLEELAPMPEFLKEAQRKLQEAQQMHLLAEKNNEALSRELQLYKDKVATVTDRIENARSDQELGEREKSDLNARLSELEAFNTELEQENADLKLKLIESECLAEDNERLATERKYEIVQLLAQVETVREESARQVARNKDRCETVRKSMQNQINELERQLAQSRAIAKSAQRDRDDIRQKMQAQITNLQANFDDAVMRIRNLQGHVNYLKSSYSTINNNNAVPQITIGEITETTTTTTSIRDPCKCK